MHIASSFFNDSVSSFNNEVGFVLSCTTRPIDIKLIRNRANPFEDFIVGFEASKTATVERNKFYESDPGFYDMKNKNYAAWVKTYAEFYGKPLEYSTL